MSNTGRENAETLKWSRVEVDAFVAFMVDEVKKCNKTTSTFNKQGWSTIKSRLDAQFGRSFTNLQLRNKMNKLRADYSSFKKLLETSGFNWNGDIRACEVTDESVWDRHVKENSTWLRFKRNGLPHWPELCTIFGDSYAIGSCATGSCEVGSTQDHSIYNDTADLDADHDTPIPSPGVGLSDNDQQQERPRTHQLDRTPSGKRKRGRSNELYGLIHDIYDIHKTRLELINTSGASTSTVASRPDYSVGDCVSILGKMLRHDKELYLRTVKKVMQDPNWREAFINMDDEQKMWFVEDQDE